MKKYENQDLTLVQGLEHLEHLNLKSDGYYGSRGGYNWLNIELKTKHDLQELVLENFAQSNPNNRLFNWFEQFPKLKTVKIIDCIVYNWPIFFDQINALENLQNLELNNVTSRNKNQKGLAMEKPSNIEVLTIDNCKEIPDSVLEMFLKNCTAEAIYLQNMIPVQVSTIRLLVHFSARLNISAAFPSTI